MEELNSYQGHEWACGGGCDYSSSSTSGTGGGKEDRQPLPILGYGSGLQARGQLQLPTLLGESSEDRQVLQLLRDRPWKEGLPLSKASREGAEDAWRPEGGEDQGGDQGIGGWR